MRLISVTFSLLLFLICSFALQPAIAQSVPGKKFTVTIDAGHGGHDSGAPGKHSQEKNLALAIALKLGHYIESLMDDVSVYYTRKVDVFIPLYERAQIANKHKSDLFISVHVNAIKNKTAPNGTSTYVMGFSRSKENLDLVMEENKAIRLEKDYKINYADFDPTDPTSYIIANNTQNNNLAQSLEIASAVQDQFRTRAQRKDMGVHQGNLVVLWGCANPSILIETGFITNPEEEAFLMTENGQDIIASAIYMAVREYKESIDQRVGIIAKATVPNTPDDLKTIERENKVADSVKKTVAIVNKPGVAEKKEPVVEKKEPVAEKKELVVEKKSADTLPSAGKETGIEYRVQIMASLKKLPTNAKDFKGLKDLEEIQIDGYYKYMSQPVKNYQEALEIQRKLGASFKGAFIVCFKDGKKVPLKTITDQKK